MQNAQKDKMKSYFQAFMNLNTLM